MVFPGGKGNQFVGVDDFGSVLRECNTTSISAKSPTIFWDVYELDYIVLVQDESCKIALFLVYKIQEFNLL